MKPITLILLLTFSTPLLAQNDTLIINNDYKWKIGVKGMVENSKWSMSSEKILVFNAGLQVIFKIKNSISSIESGIYNYERRMNFPYRDDIGTRYINEIIYSNIHIPFKYRIDTKYFYLSLGLFIEQLYNLQTSDLDRFKDNTQGVRSFNIGYIGNIGIEKTISYKYSLFIEGVLSSNLSNLSTPSYFVFNDERGIEISNYGLSVGVNYKF